MLNFKDIAKIFEEIELRLISSLKRNLARHKQEEQQYGFDWSAWQAEKLRNINKFRQENARIMNGYTNVIDSATRQIMLDEFAQGMNGVNVAVHEPVPDTSAEIVREPHFFGVDDTKINKLIDDVVNLEKHAETAVLRTMDDVYRQTVNKAQLAMSTGSITLQKAIDMSVKDFLDKGINCIVYRDGRRVNIADYVRMALRTTATRANLQGMSAKIRQLGYDTVLVSSYGMCSDTCLSWQGRPYIDDVFSMWDGEIQERSNGELWGKSHYCGKWFPLLSTAIHAGLFHPNCRHTMTMWRDGDPIPPPQDNSEIQRRYRLEQKQRRLENNVRKAKRFVEGQSDPDNLKEAKKRLHETQKELREFIANTNQNEGATILKRDYGREKIYTTVNSQNGLTSLKNNGIIEEEGNIPKYLESKSKLNPTVSNNLSLAVIGANPNYYSGDERYLVNCQRCVVAYEARRRGYDVTAKPASLDSESIKRMTGKKGWANVFEGGEDDILTIFGSKGIENKENIYNIMSGYGDGARAIVRVQWQDGRGHAFIAEQVNNKTKFIDPQSGDIDVESYFDDDLIKTDKTRLLRIDNKEFTELIEECVE